MIYLKKTEDPGENEQFRVSSEKNTDHKNTIRIYAYMYIRYVHNISIQDNRENINQYSSFPKIEEN